MIFDLLRRLAPYLIVTAIIGGSLFGAYSFGVSVEHDRAEAELAGMRLQFSKDMAAQNDANTKALAKAHADAEAERTQHAQAMEALDLKFTKEIEDAKAISERTIAGLRAGTVRVRDRFTCPTSTAAHSGAEAATSTTSVGDGAQAAGLRSEDAELVLHIAAEADQVARQLQACQAIVRADRAAQ